MHISNMLRDNQGVISQSDTCCKDQHFDYIDARYLRALQFITKNVEESIDNLHHLNFIVCLRVIQTSVNVHCMGLVKIVAQNKFELFACQVT